MNISEMLLWILCTTLLAFLVGTRYWGEHQRLEGVALLPGAQQLAAGDRLGQPQEDEAIHAALTSVVEAEAAQDAVIAAVLRTPGIELEVPHRVGQTSGAERAAEAGCQAGTPSPKASDCVVHRLEQVQGRK